jgi:gluconate 5-dehydrogenase
MAAEHRHVLITGAGHGIGAAIALAAARAGMAVSVNDLSPQRAEATVQRIRDLGSGQHASAIIGDVSTPDSARSIVAAALTAHGDLTGLVNNAGIVIPGTIRGLSPEDWERTFRVNSLGPAYVTHAAFESLARTRGAIVNLASIAVFSPAAAVGAYTASKSAVAGLTKQTALEGGPLGIRCNAIAPGFISGTDMTAAADADVAVSRRRAAAVPLRRAGRPEDVADVALFFLSAASRYVSGTVLLVDGGLNTSLLRLINSPDPASDQPD